MNEKKDQHEHEYQEFMDGYLGGKPAYYSVCKTPGCKYETIRYTPKRFDQHYLVFGY